MTHITDQIETYLTGGLSPGERTDFEVHLATCGACAAALADARAAESAMNDLFAADRPSADFEDRMIHALTLPQPWLNRPIVHPMVRRAAVGIAASLLIAGIGYVVNGGMNRGHLPGLGRLDDYRRAKASTNMENIGAAMIEYSSSGTSGGTIQQLKRSAVRLSKEGRYQDALGAVETIQQLDPKDEYALGVRPVLEDRDRAHSQHLGDAILYDDILRYPTDWAEINADDGKSRRTGMSSHNPFPADPKAAETLGKPVNGQAQANGDAQSFDLPIQDNIYGEQHGNAANGTLAWAYNDAGRAYTLGPTTQVPGSIGKTAAAAGGLGGGGGSGGGRGVGGGGGGAPANNRSSDGVQANYAPANGLDSYALATDGPDVSLASSGKGKDKELPQSQQQSFGRYYFSTQNPAGQGVALAGVPPATGAGAAPGGTAGASSEQLVKNLEGGVSKPQTTPQVASEPALQTPPPLATGVVVANGSPAPDLGMPPGTDQKELGRPANGEGQATLSVQVKDQLAEKDQALKQSTPANITANATLAVAQSDIKSQQDAKSSTAKDQSGETQAAFDPAAFTNLKYERQDAPFAGQVTQNPADVSTKPQGIHVLHTSDPEPAKPNPANAANPPVPPPHAVPAHVEAAKPKIIRTGDMDFEVESFEIAVSTITKVVEEEGGYVSTTNSDKLPNGKVKGTVVLRVTPERLDTLVLKLRGIGDLKTQNIRAQDITKQYTDLESRLRAAQIMCDQILEIIKSGKAQVKDLLEAEKQLGVYREKVEQLTGEINFYANQVSLSTLTLTLFERDIRTPALASEMETVTMTLVTERVDEAAIKAKDAIAAAKGRIIASQQAQTDEGQSTATIKAQIPPDKAEEVIAKLKQIDGKLDHFDRQRSQTTSNGSAPVDPRIVDPVKVKREDVTIDLTLYNLAKLTPRRHTDLSIAATDVDETKHALEEQVRAAGGRIIDSKTEYPVPDQKKGTVSFDVPAEKADALIASLKTLGEVLQISTIENPGGQGVTESKRGFSAVINDMAGVQPRRMTTLVLITPSIDQAQSALAEQVRTAGGRVSVRTIEHPTPQQTTGTFTFDLPAAKADAFLLTMKPVGEMIQVTTSDSNANQNVTDSKRGFQVRLLDLANVAPRHTTTLTLVPADVDQAEVALADQVREAGGRVINRNVEHPAPDQSRGTFSFEVPAEKGSAILQAIHLAGETLKAATTENTGGPIVTDSKRGFVISLRSLTTFQARERVTVNLASANVRETYNDLRDLVHRQGGHVLTERIGEQGAGNSVGQLEFDLPRTSVAIIDQQMAKDGQIVLRDGQRLPDGDDTIDSQVYVRLAITSAEQLPARQSSILDVEVTDVQRAIDDLNAAALASGGRQMDNPGITQNPNGQTTATVQYDAPLDKIQLLIDKADGMGTRKSRQTSIDAHATEGKLARARLTVTFETQASLSNPDDSLWAGVRRGLVTSLKVLSTSMTLIIIGLCVVAPFGVVLWGMWRGVKWARKNPQPTAAGSGTGIVTP